MFFFYDIEYLCLLNSLRQLELIEQDGLKIYVPEMQLLNYSAPIRAQIRELSTRSAVDLVNYDGFSEFLDKNNLVNSVLGKGFLFLLHCAKQKNGIIVIDSDRKSQLRLCDDLSIDTLSVAEFSSSIIRNKEYLIFINKITSEMI